MLSDARADPAYRTTTLDDLSRRYAVAVVNVLREAIDTAEFRDDVSLILVRDMIFGCIERQTWAFLHGEGDFPSEEVADGVARPVYHGMVAAPDGTVNLIQVLGRIEAMADRLERSAG